MYLIDGYNLLYQSDLEHPRELVAKVTNLCRAKGKRAVIVFDGWSPDDLSSGYVEVKFGGDADAEILNIIKQSDNPNEFMLVTSDNDLIFNARQKNINVIKSEQFCYLLAEDLDKEEAPDKPNVRYMSDDDVKDELESFNYFKKGL